MISGVGKHLLRDVFLSLYAITSSKDACVVNVWDEGSLGSRLIK